MCSKDVENVTNFKHPIWAIFWGFVILMLLCIIFALIPYIFKHCFDGKLICLVRCFREMKASEYGDFFGVLNTFFAGLAFVGIILSIHLQNKSLSLQLYEIKTMHDDIRKQALWQHEAQVRETFQYCLNLLESKQNSLYFVTTDTKQFSELEGASVLLHAGNRMEMIWNKLNEFFNSVESGNSISIRDEEVLLTNIEFVFNMFGACQSWFRTICVVRNELLKVCNGEELEEKMDEVFLTLTRHQCIMLSVYEDVEGPINDANLSFEKEYSQSYPDRVVHVIKCLNQSLRSSGCCRGPEGRKNIVHDFLCGLHLTASESAAGCGGAFGDRNQRAQPL